VGIHAPKTTHYRRQPGTAANVLPSSVCSYRAINSLQL